MRAFLRWLAVVLTVGIGLAVGVSCSLPTVPQPLPAATTVMRLPTASPTFGATRETLFPTETLMPTLTPRLAISETVGFMPPRIAEPVLAKALRMEAVHTPHLAQIGDRRAFWVLDLGTAEMRQITATLQAAGDHVQMWVEEGSAVDQQALLESVQMFDAKIYPTVQRAFGENVIPDIDGDPRILVLNARVAGVSGYFAPSHTLPRSISPLSNACEMLVMNIEALTPGTDPYHRVLAHEFQHMVHWYQDVNEEAWVSEGSALLAEDLVGFGPPRLDLRAYLRDVNIPLAAFSSDRERVSRHYGGAYLFMRYFFERYGEGALRALMAQGEESMAGVQAVLEELGGSLDDFVADWALANLLNDPSIGDGRYGYHAIEERAEPQVQVHRYPHTITGEIYPYGVVYMVLYPGIPATSAQALRLGFGAPATTRLVPTDPPSGRYMWWSQRGDWGHSFLEHRFDLRDVSFAELTFDLWYDMEYRWDYAGVRVSTDDGHTWTWLQGQQMVPLNRAYDAPDWGYSGRSGVPPEALQTAERSPAKWVHERIDLSVYAGQEILVRLDVFTDEAVNGPGLCLDNIALEALGFQDDVEQGTGAWRAVGFVRHANALPVDYIVQMVTFGSTVEVSRLEVEKGQGDWLVRDLGGAVEKAVLMISPTVPLVDAPLSYTLRIEPLMAP